MNLSEHFTLEELTKSQTATRFEIKEQFKPNPFITENLQQLCVNILEPIRKKIGKEIIVNSGYRCVKLNRKIGGASNSQHINGEAVDITVKGVSNLELIKIIKELNLPFDQCIEEFHQWVHISYGPRNRKQYLTAIKDNGRTIYLV